MREQIEATQAQEEKNDEKKENDDSVTTTTATNCSGGLDDDNDNNGNENENKDESKTHENERNDENELSEDALLKDILSKFSFDGGAVCVTSPIKLQSLERLKIVKIAAGNTHSMCVDSTACGEGSESVCVDYKLVISNKNKESSDGIETCFWPNDYSQDINSNNNIDTFQCGTAPKAYYNLGYDKENEFWDNTNDIDEYYTRKYGIDAFAPHNDDSFTHCKTAT